MKTTKDRIQRPNTAVAGTPRAPIPWNSRSRSASIPAFSYTGPVPIISRATPHDKLPRSKLLGRSQDSLASNSSVGSGTVRHKAVAAPKSRPHSASAARTNPSATAGSKGSGGSAVSSRISSNKENLHTTTTISTRVNSTSTTISRYASRLTSKVGATVTTRRERTMNAGNQAPETGSSAAIVPTGPTICALQKDKRQLEHQVSELVRNAETKKAEIAQLRMEINKLKEQSRPVDSSPHDVETLQAENQLLKERLLVLGSFPEHSALSDSEKALLLRKRCNSAPPSIIGGSQESSPHPRPPLTTSKSEGGGSECDLGEAAGRLYTTPDRALSDWDKHSISSMSEMSIACLQDRILQMEETHYSTNEELQATLQELTDLQDQLTELQAENERLSEDKAVILESLCSQTEKLEDCRSQVEHLRQLLLQQPAEGQDAISQSDRERKLLELLKSSEQEKESLFGQLSDHRLAAEAARENGGQFQEELAQLRDRLTLLQSTVDSANADKRLLERQLAETKEHLAGAQIELTRMRTQLENERIKVIEMQQAREAADKSELDELLDNAHKEKDRVEAVAALLNEQLSVSQCETARLREQLSILQEETMVSKNNAKKQVNDTEYKLEQLAVEAEKVRLECRGLREDLHELEFKCQRHLEDKRELRSTISELQKNLKDIGERADTSERCLEDAKRLHQAENQEWKQFQDDLLMTVRVANDFKTEAQQELERLVMENKNLRDKIMIQQADLEKAKASSEAAVSAPLSNPLQRMLRPTNSLDNPVLCSMEEEIASQLRYTRTGRSDSRPLSVRSLIESIENATKQVKAQNGGSESSSTSSLSSTISEKTPGPPILRKMDSNVYIKPPSSPRTGRNDMTPAILREQNVGGGMNGNCALTSSGGNNRVGLSDGKSGGGNGNVNPCLSGERGLSTVEGDADNDQPLKSVPSPITSILTNKLEPMRRNSYGDVLDKKDPLASLVKGGGSKRNALLKWCQNTAVGYKGIDITNFSSSWNDGLAFCALLHSYLPDKIPYDELDSKDKRRNFTLAFKAAESVGIQSTLNLNDMISIERPDWQAVMSYITAIYKHFET